MLVSLYKVMQELYEKRVTKSLLQVILHGNLLALYLVCTQKPLLIGFGSCGKEIIDEGGQRHFFSGHKTGRSVGGLVIV